VVLVSVLVNATALDYSLYSADDIGAGLPPDKRDHLLSPETVDTWLSSDLDGSDTPPPFDSNIESPSSNNFLASANVDAVSTNLFDSPPPNLISEPLLGQQGSDLGGTIGSEEVSLDSFPNDDKELAFDPFSSTDWDDVLTKFQDSVLGRTAFDRPQCGPNNPTELCCEMPQDTGEIRTGCLRCT
jgi:hypothetical protein